MGFNFKSVLPAVAGLALLCAARIARVGIAEPIQPRTPYPYAAKNTAVTKQPGRNREVSAIQLGKERIWSKEIAQARNAFRAGLALPGFPAFLDLVPAENIVFLSAPALRTTEAAYQQHADSGGDHQGQEASTRYEPVNNTMHIGLNSDQWALLT